MIRLFNAKMKMKASLTIILFIQILNLILSEKKFAHALNGPKSIFRNYKFQKGSSTSSSKNSSIRNTSSTSRFSSKPKVAPTINPIILPKTNVNHIVPQQFATHSPNKKTSFLKYSNLSHDEQRYTKRNTEENVNEEVVEGTDEKYDNRKSGGNGSGKKGDDWLGKWFEDNLHESFVQWKEFIDRGSQDVHMPYFTPDFTSVDGLGGTSVHKSSVKRIKTDKSGNVIGGVRHEIDSEMPGSTIIRFQNHEDLTSDIEILPSNAPMVDLTKLDKIESSSSSSSDQESTPNKKSIIRRIIRRRRRKKNHKEKSVFEIFGSDEHLERMDVDIRHLCLSVAGNIDNQEQWKEFFENSQGQGLKSILQCVKNVANEIRMGIDVYDDINNANMLDRETRRENAFVAACSAVKVLRDLCSIDHNWAAFITDEILASESKTDDNESKATGSSSFLEDISIMLKYANEADMFYTKNLFRFRRELKARGITRFGSRRQRRQARKRCILYINQLLLGMAFASDKAIHSFRSTEGLIDTILLSSSYTSEQKLRGRWLRYPFEKFKRVKDAVLKKETQDAKQAFLEAAKVQGGLKGKIQTTSNKLLAALGHNIFVPKVPGQRGLRILSLDGGGSRGVATIAIIKALVDEMGVEVCDLFDIICGTSTGAIIAFLVGMRLESSEKARNRYDELVEKIFVKSSLSTPMLFLTTAAYSEVPFKKIMEEILGDSSMLDSRADPRVPYVFAVSSKMSSTTSKISLFRNYNYSGGEKPDKFTVNPQDARRKLGFNYSTTNDINDPHHTHKEGSRHEGSFRVLQRAALRATTAAPTVFKPVVMAGDIYSDGGIVASNPTAIAIHEARTIFPDIPIELCVSCGTGEFVSEKKTPSFGWDGIVSQIVKSATDTAKTHWVLEDILGQGASGSTSTKYFRFDPVIGTPQDFPIDGTDSKRLEELSQLTTNYMKEAEQANKLKEIKKILNGRRNPFSW